MKNNLHTFQSFTRLNEAKEEACSCDITFTLSDKAIKTSKIIAKEAQNKAKELGLKCSITKCEGENTECLSCKCDKKEAAELVKYLKGRKDIKTVTTK